jgi:hypothetical protein
MANTLHPCECARWSNAATGENTGCDAETKGRFAPGHDAKLKGLLVRANVEDQLLRRDEKEMTVAEALADYFPRWTTRVHKSTRSIQANLARKVTRANRAQARRASRKPEPEARECSSGGCGMKALPGQELCRVCALMANMAVLLDGEPRGVTYEPTAIPRDAPPSRKGITSVEWVEVDSAKAATTILSDDATKWYVRCEGGCGRKLPAPKALVIPQERRGAQTVFTERRFSAPEAQICSVCNPTWPAADQG